MARARGDYGEIDRIRRTVVVALFSDDLLFDRLVLKGGNALRLIYGIEERASLDLDFSLDGELTDVAATGERLIRRLSDRLDSLGYGLFDAKFEARPPTATGRWGGYLLEFKIIERTMLATVGTDLEAARRNALALDPAQRRNWRVEISKFEVCDDKVRFELDSQTIFVYSPAMMVIEKLRALCQQLPEYPLRSHPTPRARDLYDIRALLQHGLVERKALAEQGELARAVFRAKDVPLELLGRLRTARDFHATDWPAVLVSTRGITREFDDYFDFVVELAEALEALWKE